MRIIKNSISVAFWGIIYTIELLIAVQIFRLCYLEAGATNLPNNEFYTLVPFALFLSALYGIGMNLLTHVRQVGILSPNILWLVLCLFLGISFDVPQVTGPMSAWMIVQSIFVFSKADCYEYGFLEPFLGIKIKLRDYKTSQDLEKAKKKDLLNFIIGNACFHILYLTGFITFLVKLFY